MTHERLSCPVSSLELGNKVASAQSKKGVAEASNVSTVKLVSAV